MEKILPDSLQEVVFASSDPSISRQISKLEKSGKIRKIAPRIYTSNLAESPETIIRRNLYLILGNLYPGAVWSHRSALEFRPTTSGHVFLTYSYTKKVKLPGITLRFLHGHGPVEGDNLLSGGLYASQLERALLENLQDSRRAGPESKTCSREELENRLELVVRTQGEKGLNALRDRARQLSEILGLKREFERLHKIIGAILTSRPSRILSSPTAMARAFGHPYDPARIPLFEKLFTVLANEEFPDLPDPNTSPTAFRRFAFFEAYFSNFIEGTEFDIEDARRIIETETPMPSRNEDSHDILGTFHLVGNQQEMSITPETSEQMIDILLRRHRILLSARASKQPGQFKDKNNRAGDTFFVDYTLARGTLIRGFDFYQALKHPFAKAAFIMFLISEVHPFLDGNGRTARVMMNAELVKQQQARILIPTVYRDDYMTALRSLSRQNDPSVYLHMLQRAQLMSAAIQGEDWDAMRLMLEKGNAFKESSAAVWRLPA